MGIFKTYDVRGIYPLEINEQNFYSIGRRLKKLGIKKIAVARDARLHSEQLCQSLIKGLIDSGTDVIFLGLTTSPMLSYYCAKNKMFGAMITASHNPKEYNGIKFVNKDAIQISYEQGLFKLENELKKKEEKPQKNKGKIILENPHADYTNHLLDFFEKKIKRKIKVVFDCSNGVGSLALDALKELNIEYIIINEVPDGCFSAHSCDQTKKENLAQLQKKVKSTKADLGIMFDGDADRCAFVDEKGNIIRLDIAYLILSLFELHIELHKNRDKNKKLKILFDLRCGKIVSEEIQKAGGIPVMMRVGNPFYKKALKKDAAAIMGGELSGHIMYKQNYGIDDPFFASLKMIEILSNAKSGTKETMSQITKKFDKYYSSGEISYSVKRKDEIIDRIIKEHKDSKMLKIDGISIIEKSYWFNVRKSNTEPVIRIIIEGENKKIVDAQKEVIETIINQEERQKQK